MTKILRAFLLPLLFFAGSGNIYALEVWAAAQPKKETAAVNFCGLFKVEYAALRQTPFGEVVVMPKELGGYKNIVVTSKVLDEKIKTCLKGNCAAAPCKEPVLEVAQARRAGQSKSVLVSLSLDGELALTFFLSAQKRGWRVKGPQDLKYIDGKFRKRLRVAVIDGGKGYL
jgi:hypothetical protein